MYGGCHKISQVCCGINLKFEQILRSLSSIHLPDFCDAISSPFCYSDAMGHISPICGVPVTSGWWKEERYPRTQSPSHHSVGFLYMLAKEVLGCWESKIIEKNPMLWYLCCCFEHLSRLDPAVSPPPNLRESASLGLTMLDRWEQDMLGCGNTGKRLVLVRLIVVSMKSAYARSTMAGAPPMSRGSSSQGSWASAMARDMVAQKQV